MMRSTYLPFVLVITGVSIFAAADRGSVASEKTTSKVPRESLERRLEAARNVVRLNLQRFKTGEAFCDDSVLSSWSERLLAAELAMIDNPADRAAALKVHVERTREVERIAAAHAKAGQGRESDVEAAKYFVIIAEIQLREATSE